MEIRTLADVDKQMEALLPILKSYNIHDIVDLIKEHLIRYNISHFVEHNDIFGKIACMDYCLERKYSNELMTFKCGYHVLISSTINSHKIKWKPVNQLKFLYEDVCNNIKSYSLCYHYFMAEAYRIIYERKYYYNNIHSVTDKLKVVDWETGQNVIITIHLDDTVTSSVVVK